MTSSQAQDEASTAASYLGGTCLFRKLNTEKVTDSANSVSYKRQESSAYARSLERQGDQLFRQDTIESINEATQIYLLASEILGRRPAENPSRSSVTPATYREFEGQWDDFANKWEATTDLLPFSPWTQTYPLMLNASLPGAQLNKPPIDVSVLASVGALVFCVPGNDNLLSYWDTLDDRLFKIRHCQNVDGIERQLPLFEPPIDPGLLVRATAAGLDIGTILADLNAPLPSYRFAAMLQKAVELCGEVRALGGALLAALEKQDTEHLALLRSSHEIQLLQLVKDIKEKQQTEAEHNLSALRKSRELAAQRYRQYQHLLGKPQIQIPGEQDVAALDVSRLNPASSAQATGDVSGLALTSPELDHLSFLNSANTFSIIAGGFNTAGGIAHVVPDFQIGAGAPPPAVHWGVRPQLDRDFFQHTVQRRQFSRQPQCNHRRS